MNSQFSKSDYAQKIARAIIDILKEDLADYIRQKVQQEIREHLETILDDIDRKIETLEDKIEELKEEIVRVG